WSAVYDEATGLHNRTFLYDRLSLECERAEHSGGVFYVIILQIRLYRPTLGPLPTLSNAMLQQVAELINRLTRRSDLVALLGGSELAILAFELVRDSQDDLLDYFPVRPVQRGLSPYEISCEHYSVKAVDAVILITRQEGGLLVRNHQNQVFLPFCSLLLLLWVR
ncbi:MAG: diguanylate cyclase, partial [Deltaproteobacteria bacterium]|nr:diguanylate cyclase [Deltaproteobacteria bacterium]